MAAKEMAEVVKDEICVLDLKVDANEVRLVRIEAKLDNITQRLQMFMPVVPVYPVQCPPMTHSAAGAEHGMKLDAKIATKDMQDVQQCSLAKPEYYCMSGNASEADAHEGPFGEPECESSPSKPQPSALDEERSLEHHQPIPPSLAAPVHVRHRRLRLPDAASGVCGSEQAMGEQEVGLDKREERVGTFPGAAEGTDAQSGIKKAQSKLSPKKQECLEATVVQEIGPSEHGERDGAFHGAAHTAEAAHAVSQEGLASDEANVGVGDAKSKAGSEIQDMRDWTMEGYDNDPCHEVMIRQIYAAMQPAKLPELPALFEKYKRRPGGPRVMHSMVYDKYLPDDSDD